MRAPHLRPALAAILLCTGGLGGTYLYARSLESRYIHALAPRLFPLRNLGSALQREAFRQPDLLPAYGSSELEFDDDFHASKLFRNYPTGFTIFPVAQAGTSNLIILQRLAAIGGDLRGKKVVVSMTPTTFFFATIPPKVYAGNFSRLHASELAFSTDLSMAVKQAAARRMLEYPATLKQDVLLRFAVEKLADDSVGSLALYYLALPLGKLQNVVLRLQDHWDTLLYLVEQGDLNPPERYEIASLDWPALLDQAERDYRRHSNSNPFGFHNGMWEETFRAQANARPEAIEPIIKHIRSLSRTMPQSKEWVDLELVLQALQDLGAQPLIAYPPQSGLFYAHWGATAEERRYFYQRLESLAERYGVPVVDFADHDGDTHFLVDPGSHLSSKGWIYFSEALDAFYHQGTESAALAKRLPPGPGFAPDTGKGPVSLYEGLHEAAGAAGIRGWAWDDLRPNTPISVDVYDGKKLLATVLADQFRPGLLKAGKGNGYHAFDMPIPESLRDGRRHAIRVAISGTTLDLKNTPQTMLIGARKTATLEGVHDATSGPEIAGWAWDSAEPDAPIEVDIYDGKTRLGTILADRLRPDLVKAGKGNGRHAFVFPLPYRLRDGRPHQISVKFAGTALDLRQTPRTIAWPPKQQ